MKKNVLVLGSGGREHAIAWALAKSPGVGKIFCAPGNPGIGHLAELLPLSLTDFDGIIRAVRSLSIDLTVVGPEAPLAAGIVDKFAECNLPIFGPTKNASELEWSKSFAKGFMARHGIPTASYSVFTSETLDTARSYFDQHVPPFVVKADGLAAGKGVVICRSKDEALETLNGFLKGSVGKEAGTRVVVEEFLSGEEASVFAVTDGTRYVLLAPAQDHKRALDGDEGKNTGGMGAYAPASCVTSAILTRVEKEIVVPAIKGMASEGRTYRGCLYVGLMLTASGPKVVEFNCRFGDPETQVVLPLYDGDLLRLLDEAARGELSGEALLWPTVRMRTSAVCVVIASGGYPDKYETGFPIENLDAIEGREELVAFHAGTALKDGRIVTAGGRVLGITAIDTTGSLRRAIDAAYRGVQSIAFPSMHFRKDIAARGLR